MSYYDIFKPNRLVEEYIEHIRERKRAENPFLDLISETSELKRLISPDLMARVREISVDRYVKYVKKRFRSEEEYPGIETARRMLRYYAYKEYLKYFFKEILGCYGIGSFYYIYFHRFANALYYRFSQNSPALWGHEIKRMEERMFEDLGIIDSVAKEKADEVFFVTGVTMARLYYWLKYTGEGEGEIEAMIDMLTGVKRRKKRTAEDKLIEMALKGEAEVKGGSEDVSKAQVSGSLLDC
jgi:hypothetical protein